MNKTRTAAVIIQAVSPESPAVSQVGTALVVTSSADRPVVKLNIVPARTKIIANRGSFRFVFIVKNFNLVMGFELFRD